MDPFSTMRRVRIMNWTLSLWKKRASFLEQLESEGSLTESYSNL